MQVTKSFIRAGVKYRPGDKLPSGIDKTTLAGYKRLGMVDGKAEESEAEAEAAASPARSSGNAPVKQSQGAVRTRSASAPRAPRAPAAPAPSAVNSGLVAASPAVENKGAAAGPSLGDGHADGTSATGATTLPLGPIDGSGQPRPEKTETPGPSETQTAQPQEQSLPGPSESTGLSDQAP